jgi:hypothetical protein
MPAVTEAYSMTKADFDELKRRIYEGADLYISLDGAILSNLEELTGIRILDSYKSPYSSTAVIDGMKIAFTTSRTMITEPTTAKILAKDSGGAPLLYENAYGKGKVIVCMAPIEKELLLNHNADLSAYVYVYRKLLGDRVDDSVIKSVNSSLVYTVHPTDSGYIAVILNHTDKTIPSDLVLTDGLTIEKTLYGDLCSVGAFNACIVKIK